MSRSLLLAVALTTLPHTHAAEVTVETQPFRIERTVAATLLPAQPHLIAIEPESWGDFTIESIRPHGAEVKKGDVLVKFDRDSYDRKLADAQRALKSLELALASQELGFSKLEEETNLKLAAARRAGRVSREELDYYTATGRKTDEEDAAQYLENSKRRLEAAQEELKQLRMMYEADDLTEQTEEIILNRQEYAVKAAELDLQHAELSTKRSLEVMIPRKAESLQADAASSAIDLEKAEKNLPRSLEIARLDLEAARLNHARTKEDLADLEKDAAFLELKAPADGVFYHGSLDEGRWTLGELAKALVKGGKVPFIRPFASVVPAEPDLQLVAHVDEATARTLKKTLKGNLTAAGREDVALTATIGNVAEIPGADGRYRVDLVPEWQEDEKLEWPADLEVAAGMTLECRFIVHQSEKAISLPVKALIPGADGIWTVRVKMADGKNETRTVARGRVSGDKAEILSGLENGQVVVVPD